LIRQIADAALAALSGQFDAVYAAEGRPPIPPERLLWALLIQAWASPEFFTAHTLEVLRSKAMKSVLRFVAHRGHFSACRVKNRDPRHKPSFRRHAPTISR
jgi:hypothetical protein